MDTSLITTVCGSPKHVHHCCLHVYSIIIVSMVVHMYIGVSGHGGTGQSQARSRAHPGDGQGMYHLKDYLTWLLLLIDLYYLFVGG